MANIERKNVAAAPAPANWHEVRVGSLVVYRNPKQEIAGQVEVETPYTNDEGEFMYVDGEGGQGYFAEGSEPAGWLRTPARRCSLPTAMPVALLATSRS